jgi:glycopeptide antibiotics resistance protein
MRTLLQPGFVALALTFVVHQVLQKGFHVSLYWIDSYLDPLLSMPILLTLLLAERRHLFGRGNQYQLSLLEVVLAVGILSLLFEVIFPMLSPRFTADVGDVIAYVIGGMFFYLLLNKPLAKEI